MLPVEFQVKNWRFTTSTPENRIQKVVAQVEQSDGSLESMGSLLVKETSSMISVYRLFSGDKSRNIKGKQPKF